VDKKKARRLVLARLADIADYLCDAAACIRAARDLTPRADVAGHDRLNRIESAIIVAAEHYQEIASGR